MISRRAAVFGIPALVPAALAAAPPEVPPRPPPHFRPGSRLDALMPGLAPRLDLRNPRTGESWSGWFAGSPGGDEAAIAELEWFLRDWREGVCVSICKRVLYGLAAVRAEARGSGARGPIEILSGYRTPRTNARIAGAAAGSLHMYGRAADFRLAGVSAAATASIARALEIGGVGFYPAEGFVHIDSGRVRRWTGRRRERG